MEKFEDFYNRAIDIANCVYGNLEDKRKVRDVILTTCFLFAKQYKDDFDFKKQVVNYMEVKTKYR